MNYQKNSNVFQMTTLENKGLIFDVNDEDINIDDIILNTQTKDIIETILDEYLYKDFLNKYNLETSNKILFEGEPGCGKTMLSFIIGKRLNKKVKVVNLSTLISSHLGETSKNISNIFNSFNSKEEILFLDEFDMVGRSRSDKGNTHDSNEIKRVVNSLLQIIDFFPQDGFIIFATNNVEVIDKAIIRRMDHIINIPKPSSNDIKDYLNKLMLKFDKIKFDIDINELSNKYLNESYSNIKRDFINKTKKYIISNLKNNKKKNFIMKIEHFIK